MSNSIISLFAAEKLIGENYASWKSNLNTILVVDNLRFVLTGNVFKFQALIHHKLFIMHMISGLKPIMIKLVSTYWLA